MLCQRFGETDIAGVMSQCLCSDQMTSLQQPADVTADVMGHVQRWWRTVSSKGGYNVTLHGQTEVIPQVYELIVARSVS